MKGEGDVGELERTDAGLIRAGAPGGLAELSRSELTELARHIAGELATQSPQDLAVPEPGVARAYVYHGEWVADCPRPGCSNVEFVTGKHNRHRGRAGTRGVPYQAYACTYCGYQGPIDWPPDGEKILQVLEQRPLPHNRNWYPVDHPVAVAAGIPHGQTVAELLAENAQNGVW